MTPEHVHFVTGRLAAASLEEVLKPLAEKVGFSYSIDILPITVAALMTPQWVAKRMNPPAEASRIVLPGYCRGDLAPVEAITGASVELGPRDLRKLPAFFGRKPTEDYGDYDIEIIAEINHAPRLSLAEIVSIAKQLQADGADVIDVGCEPGGGWTGVADCVAALRDEGLRVSIDSLSPDEIEPAVKAGASLVLSVNSSNREAAPAWGCEVVVIPDDPRTLAGLDETIEYLASRDVRLRIDPILEPIGCGFAASIGRYIETRKRYPDAEMMMGIGNITELTDADSAGLNLLLLSLCQELGIHSVLTTQVINWARTSVKECDIARRMAHYAVSQKIPPKHVDNRLLMLRDAAVTAPTDSDLLRLAAEIKDHNYRLFAQGNQLHAINSQVHAHAEDPFKLFEALVESGATNLDASHAFYLGYELAKAEIASQLGKQYQQDEPLDWGFLTRTTAPHRIKLSGSKAAKKQSRSQRENDG